ncbi:tripartite tricarboxylate transporter permease [Paracoccus laeviglucosivorans]|uniref:TctA family transporter n=1 Tax=Paracoccus laeviglucosivorans TaxID=1197861 RepID=A0A521ERL3_9RHOB|nr:tripartite tricarboxylate transporter permease [Paracoccus laeviglucosivorans]SMO86566.1 TctA family transporter [Paracoccus laeviglucosivorans]
MDLLSNLAGGFAQALTLTNLFYCFIGVTVGTFVGVLPGIGSMIAISLLLPLTFYLPPDAALVMLAGIYYGGEYGGSIASIMINLPGSASTAVTALDGYQMTKKGRAGQALFLTAIASFIGGSMGIVLLSIFSPLLADLSLRFGPADYFSVMVLGLIAATCITQGSILKSCGAVVVGVLLGTVGTDVNTGAQRFTFGNFNLYDGISIVIIAMGLFGLPEIIANIGKPQHGSINGKVRLRDMKPTRDDVRDSTGPVVRGGLLGSLLGALPATGPTIAAFLSYAVEKRVSRRPERFGTGTVEGVTGPEAANNAAAQTAFIPTLTLGIPGSATMALILGALMIHGIPPGPRLMTEHADLFWALVASFWIGNLLLLVLNIPMVGIWIRLLNIPYRFLFPAVVCLTCVGVYSLKLASFDVYLVLGVCLLGYAMRLLRIDAAPLLMGVILGPMIEEYFRRALLMSRGDLSVFLTEPISAGVILATILMVLWAAIKGRRLAEKLQ